MEDRQKVAVLMGGMSSEHEVSLHSGQGVTDALRGGRYEPIPVIIEKNGSWRFPGTEPVSVYDALPRLRDLALDCVFIALHGEYGEDGRIQGVLDYLGLPYTGSGCAASALAMDKHRSKTVVAAAGVPVAAQVLFQRGENQELSPEWAAKEIAPLGYPCVVKPICQGSSVGVVIAQDERALLAGVDAALRYDDLVMIERFVRGVEVTCAVYDAEPGAAPRALPVTEIRPKTARFFDYEAKYTPGASEEITPAEISPEMTERVQRMSECAHTAVGCRGWSRSDFIIGAEGPVWIEINTIPGLTKTSLYPQAAAAAGISYAELMGRFIDAAIKEAKMKKEQ